MKVKVAAEVSVTTIAVEEKDGGVRRRAGVRKDCIRSKELLALGARHEGRRRLVNRFIMRSSKGTPALLSCSLMYSSSAAIAGAL